LLRRFVATTWVCAIGASVFALHPLQVEPVTWVTGLRDLLALFFTLGALLIGDKLVTLNPAVNGNRRVARYLVTTVLFGLAMMSKPSAVVFPAVALTVWIFFRG